jgi:thioredoxin-related protein
MGLRKAATHLSERNNIMKKTAVLFMIVAGLMFASHAFAAGELRWFSLQEGMEKAKAEKKPMIVDFFYGKGCPRCEFLQKNVYDDPRIAGKIMADFVPIRVDLTKKLTKDEEKLGNRYDFKNDCLLLFLDPRANIIKEKGKRLCFVDKVDPDEFIKYLDTIKTELPK